VSPSCDSPSAPSPALAASAPQATHTSLPALVGSDNSSTSVGCHRIATFVLPFHQLHFLIKIRYSRLQNSHAIATFSLFFPASDPSTSDVSRVAYSGHHVDSPGALSIAPWVFIGCANGGGKLGCIPARLGPGTSPARLEPATGMLLGTGTPTRLGPATGIGIPPARLGPAMGSGTPRLGPATGTPPAPLAPLACIALPGPASSAPYPGPILRSNPIPHSRGSIVGVGGGSRLLSTSGWVVRMGYWNVNCVGVGVGVVQGWGRGWGRGRDVPMGWYGKGCCREDEGPS
jgi:hypothetical protein